MPISKTNFCSTVLLLSELPRYSEGPQTTICCSQRSERLICLATGLNVSLVLALRIGYLIVSLPRNKKLTLLLIKYLKKMEPQAS